MKLDAKWTIWGLVCLCVLFLSGAVQSAHSQSAHPAAVGSTVASELADGKEATDEEPIADINEPASTVQSNPGSLVTSRLDDQVTSQTLGTERASSKVASQAAVGSKTAGVSSKVASQAAVGSQTAGVSSKVASQAAVGSQTAMRSSAPASKLMSVNRAFAPEQSKPSSSPSPSVIAGSETNAPSSRPISLTVPSRDAYKPKIPDEFVPHLFQFNYVEGEPCSELVKELSKNPATQQAYMYLEVIISTMVPEMHDTTAERMQSDKVVKNAFENLKEEMVKGHGPSHSSSDLIGYMDRLIRCKVDPVKDGRTILQKVLELGMEESFDTKMVKDLLSGFKFDPAHTVDAYGNTLMHLAVMSGSQATIKKLIDAEAAKNSDSDRQINVLYWMLSTLNHANKDGKKPVELAPLSMRDSLKTYFRLYTRFGQIALQKARRNVPVLQSKL